MHFFAHEMLSKFQVFEVKHEDKSVTCIHMVSANCELHGVSSCGAFCSYKAFTFFDPKNLLKLYSVNLIFFECSLNYSKVDANSYF